MGREHSGWERSQVNMRLTARRKAMLRQVARAEPGVDSPQRALDRALELALAPHEESGASIERLAGVEAALSELRAAQAVDASRLQSSLSKLADSVDALRALIAQVAAEEF